VRHEVDVVGLHRHAGRAKITFLGEAKVTITARGPADLHRLDQIKDILRQQGHDVSATRLGVFAMHGFTRDLLAAAERRRDVLLVDLPMLIGQRPPAAL
jgi:hypothetical protein